MKDRKFIVGPETERMLALGHPWVLGDRYTKRWPSAKVGEVVPLTNEQGKLLAVALLEPVAHVVARVLEFSSMKLGSEWVRGKVMQAKQLREQHIDLSDTTAFRLINGEGDGLPGITVDRYGDYLMIQLYAESWRPHLSLLIQVLQQVFSPKGIYEKRRTQKTRELEAVSDHKKYSRLLAGSACVGRLPVQENGLEFLVDLEEGLNTGLFFDQRVNRRDLMGRVNEKTVLNLFAYTGAFSVAAASSGAARVTSVDVSSYYLSWAEDNFLRNRINPRRHEFIVDDCMKTLRRLQGVGRKFDVILMDPPSFSTTKKSRFTTRGGTSALVSVALPLLVDGGLLITSSNHQKVDLADYLKELRRGALEQLCNLRVVRIMGQSEDFPFPLTYPEGRYLKYVMAVKGSGKY
jgi:23S rRNA (cytosine1962-C5)-methyltransferase